MACLGPVFEPKSPPEKVYVGPFFCILSQEMRKFYFEKVYVLFSSLNCSPKIGQRKRKRNVLKTHLKAIQGSKCNLRSVFPSRPRNWSQTHFFDYAQE